MPIETFALTGPGPARSRFQVSAARGLTRFVGRQTEMDVLFKALAQARAGHGQVVAVVGEPGVGKSRLSWEVMPSLHAQGYLTLEAAAASYGNATIFAPVIALLRTYFQIESRDDPRKIREKVTGKLLSLDRALALDLASLLWLLAIPVDDPEWERLDPPERRQKTFRWCEASADSRESDPAVARPTRDSSHRRSSQQLVSPRPCGRTPASEYPSLAPSDRSSALTLVHAWHSVASAGRLERKSLSALASTLSASESEPL